MNLQELINQNLLEAINGISFEQIKKKFVKALAYFNLAEKNLDYDSEVIYTNIYNAARIIGETLLLLNGYKAKITDHHKTVMQAARLIMNDNKMDEVFNRLERMRKQRNIIDYDIERAASVSKQDLEQSIIDVNKYANKVKELINKADLQQKLIK